MSIQTIATQLLIDCRVPPRERQIRRVRAIVPAIQEMPRGSALTVLLTFYTTDVVQVALKERGIDKLLEEAREDAKETDEIHMRPRCAYIS